MANILFLAHRIPYPPTKGDKIRSWNFLSRLAKHHTVHAGFFVDDKKDLDHLPVLDQVLASYCAVPVSSFEQKLLSLRAFFTGVSLTECSYPRKKIAKYCNRLISNEKIDVIFVFSAAPMALIDGDCSLNVVADLVDVDSEKWRDYSQRAAWPLSGVFAREAIKLAKFEAKVVDRSARTLLVSEEEAGILRECNPGAAEKIVAVKNGVDTAFFNPRNYEAETVENSLLFTGALDYQPNIEAVSWFCEAIWPLVLDKNSEALFYIAGSSPTAEILDKAYLPGVEVLRDVPDMAEVIAKAQIVVAPLLTARGIQNKVLEAMAMATPTVSTSVANAGINGVSGEHLLVADTPLKFAEAVAGLLEDTNNGASIGSAARTFVKKNFSWESSYEELDNIIAGLS